jgi:hypothetical protein
MQGITSLSMNTFALTHTKQNNCCDHSVIARIGDECEWCRVYWDISDCETCECKFVVQCQTTGALCYSDYQNSESKIVEICTCSDVTWSNHNYMDLNLCNLHNPGTPCSVTDIESVVHMSPRAISHPDHAGECVNQMSARGQFTTVCCWCDEYQDVKSGACECECVVVRCQTTGVLLYPDNYYKVVDRCTCHGVQWSNGSEPSCNMCSFQKPEPWSEYETKKPGPIVIALDYPDLEDHHQHTWECVDKNCGEFTSWCRFCVKYQDVECETGVCECECAVARCKVTGILLYPDNYYKVVDRCTCDYDVRWTSGSELCCNTHQPPI